MRPPLTSKPFLYLFVFVTGLSIIAIELTASRILAPYFGSSIFIWGNIIGVTLAALAIGYRWGGRLADRHPRAEVLYWVVAIGGVLAALIPLVFRAVVEFILANMVGFQLVLIAGSFASVVLLFALPLLLMGISSPFVIRLLTSDVATTGNTAGSVYAFSTVGSIIGAYISTFLTIPFLGSRETMFLFSFMVIGIAAIGLVRRTPAVIALPLLPIALWLLTSQQAVRSAEGLVYETESPYQFIQVLEEPSGDLTLRTNDGRAIQSIYASDSAYTRKYFDYYAILPYVRGGDTARVLNIGHAGGTISRIYLEEVSADLDITFDGVEIDPAMTAAARTYFNLDALPVQVFHEDGRNFLRREGGAYDIIIVDAYSQQIYIPFHLTTQEFFTLIRDRLTPGGLMSINVNAVSEDSKLLTSMYETIASVFPYVTSAPTPGTYNYFIVASMSPFDFHALQKQPSDPYILELTRHIEERSKPVVVRNAAVLTDNRAPVELLTDAMFFTLLQESRLDELL